VATTANAIGRVYTARRGPTSCMDRNHNFYHDNCPTRAYAGGDLSVAYLGTLGAMPDDDRIFARAVVWEAERAFVRAYGDVDAMIAALLAAGYTQRSSWRGARIMAIASGRFWVVPYIDGTAQRLGERGQYLVIGEGQICGSNTDGLAPMIGSVCEHCEGETDHDDRLCSNCQDERFDCANCNDEYFGDYHTINDDCWCSSCYREQRRTCAHCRDRYDSGESSDSDSEYCDDCRDEIVTCEVCYSEGHSDDLVLIDIGGHLRCKDCRIAISRPRRRREPTIVIRNGVVIPLPHSPAISPLTPLYMLLTWIERVR